MRTHRNTLWRYYVVTLLAGMLAMTGCALHAAADVSGATEREALGLTLAEQYALAAERHRELNDRLSELQLELFTDDWLDGSVASEVIPVDGTALGTQPRGATNKTSYYFRVTRWYQTDQNVAALVRATAERWADKGWQVEEYVSQVNGEVRVSTTTDDGFWFSATEEGDRIELKGFSPVYWGDHIEVSEAIYQRRIAEDAAGVLTWDTSDRDENGHAYRPPGVYRPLPAWDAVPGDSPR